MKSSRRQEQLHILFVAPLSESNEWYIKNREKKFPPLSKADRFLTFVRCHPSIDDRALFEEVCIFFSRHRPHSGFGSHLEAGGVCRGREGGHLTGWIVFKSGYLELMYLECGRGVLVQTVSVCMATMQQ